jgi:hypothetical protein
MIRKRLYSGALTAWCLMSVLPPAAAAGLPSRTKLHVAVYDLVQLSKHNIRLATDEASRLMREAGVDVVWQFPLSEPEPEHVLKLDPTAQWDLAGEPFIVGILASAPKGLPYALGYSLPAEPEWVHAVVFDDRIEEVHYRNRVSYSSLLGCAIAHEVTHMLLKSSAHSVRGVMKARWERTDLLDIACGRLSFNPEENTLIVRAALRWLSAHHRS